MKTAVDQNVQPECDSLRNYSSEFAAVTEVMVILQIFCLSSAMHGQNINLPVSVCVCVCVCVSVTLFCQLAYRSDPSTDFYS